MKYTIVILLLISISGMAQKTCRYRYDKTDEFSNERVRKTIVKIVDTYFVTGLNRVGDKYYFIFWKRYRSEENFTLKKGAFAKLKLENGNIIELVSDKDEPPKTKIIDETVVTEYDIAYSMTREQMEKIAESGIVAARIQLDEEYTYKIGKKKMLKTQQNAACLLTD